MAITRVISLSFDELTNRLLRQIGYLIHSGQTTERRLAGKIDISQPHLHNILSGARKLTPAVADQALYYLDWSVLDLIETPEALALISRREAIEARGRHIDFAHSAVGTGFQFPGVPDEEIPVPFVWLARAESPLAVIAGADPEMEGIVEAGDTLLVDRGVAARERIDWDALYVVRCGADSLARWVRFSSRGLYVFSMNNRDDPHGWQLIEIAPGRRLEIVEGRIIALARPLDGKYRRPAPPSASN